MGVVAFAPGELVSVLFGTTVGPAGTIETVGPVRYRAGPGFVAHEGSVAFEWVSLDAVDVLDASRRIKSITATGLTGTSVYETTAAPVVPIRAVPETCLPATVPV
jgi:hypothetical protein